MMADVSLPQPQADPASPLAQAWAAHKASLAYANFRRWAVEGNPRDRCVDDALVDCFTAGWIAGTVAERAR